MNIPGRRFIPMQTFWDWIRGDRDFRSKTCLKLIREGPVGLRIIRGGEWSRIFFVDNMETKIWQDIILKSATWILIPKGRIAYEGMKGNGSRFPSALIGFNVKIPKYVKGTILLLKEGRFLK